jgi:hypothetical protein
MTDIGDILAVPKDQQIDGDPPPAYNADAGFDINVVPDGEYHELSTADEDEPIAGDDDEIDDDGGDGAPLHFLSPCDPEGGE